MDYEHFSWPINTGFGEAEKYSKQHELRNIEDIEKLPPGLEDTLLRLKQYADEMKKTYEEPYPIKNARIEFIYESVAYVLYPAAFDIEDSQLEIMSDKILCSLKSCGCSSANYSGCMD